MSKVVAQLLREPQLLLPITALANYPTLIVAPHPDDESLGCGGAIALLRQLGGAVKVLVVSDGNFLIPTLAATLHRLYKLYVNKKH